MSVYERTSRTGLRLAKGVDTLPFAVIRKTSNREEAVIEELTALFTHSGDADRAVDLLNKKCPQCGKGRDTDGDGNCALCGETFKRLEYKGIFRFKENYVPGDIVRHSNGIVPDNLFLCISACNNIAPDQPIKAGHRPQPWRWIPNIRPSKKVVQEHVKDLAGRVLTVIDALITNETQLKAFKIIVKKEFREELRRIANFYNQHEDVQESEANELQEIVTDTL